MSENREKKLTSYKRIEGDIAVITGLRIGGNADVIEIGGNDNPIIRNPLNGEPYIPGSSIKGKMRSLLEWKLGKVGDGGNVHQWKECKDTKCPICRIFGTSAGDDAKIGPTRLIVRDAELTQEFKDKMHKEGIILVEQKYENSLNRITARANPRPIERVPAGVKFRLDISYRVFNWDGDEGKTDTGLFEHVLNGLRYIEQDTLGGAGSRGCGKVRFENLKDEEENSIDLKSAQS